MIDKNLFLYWETWRRILSGAAAICTAASYYLPLSPQQQQMVVFLSVAINIVVGLIPNAAVERVMPLNAQSRARRSFRSDERWPDDWHTKVQ